MQICFTVLPANGPDMRLTADYLQLRKEIFVTKKGWSLSHAEAFEFEQYDHFGYAIYALASDSGGLIAGARLIRCDSVLKLGSHNYSYMLRDSALGLLTLPTNILDQPAPVDPFTWEVTRFVSLDRRGHATRFFIDSILRYLASRGATQCLYLGSPALYRIATRLGFSPLALGPIVSDQSGRFMAFGCDVPCYPASSKEGRAELSFGKSPNI